MPCKIRVWAALLALVAVMPSCTEYIHASNDWAKEKEAGGSAVSEFDRLDFNIGLFFDPLFGWARGINDKEPADDKAEAPSFGMLGDFQYIGKGGKYEGNTSIHLNYLELPVYGTYTYPVGDGKLLGGIGPFFAYGIGGKVKSSGFSEPAFGENNGGYKRFDAGAAFMAAYLYKDFMFGFRYDLGLVNKAYSSMDITSKSRSFGFNIGYSIPALFRKKK